MKQVCDISLLDKQKIENEFPCSYIVDVNEKDFTLISPKQITTIYIMFDKDYKFKTIPKGFGLEPNWDENEMTWSKTEFNTIRFNINYFKDNVLRKLKDVLDEINEYNKILYKWAEELPYINERNDENE